MKSYQVNVTRKVCNLETVIVDAETNEKAKELAIAKYINSRPPPDTHNFTGCWLDY